VEIDKAGRIAIPQSLREFSALSRECVILGIEKYIELWDADQYRSYWEDNEAEFRPRLRNLGQCFYRQRRFRKRRGNRWNMLMCQSFLKTVFVYWPLLLAKLL
jgi:hypothetical protein